MKRLLGLIACTLPLFSVAEFVVPIETVEEYVNIRMIPDAKSEIVGRLFQGDSATLVQSVPEWHEIRIAGGATGFISSEWTNVVDALPVPGVVTKPAETAVADIESIANAEETDAITMTQAAEEIAEIVVVTQRRAETSAKESSSVELNESDSTVEGKKNIVELTPEEALAALANLEPVTFNYRQEDQERHVGFVAENVPDLIASSESEGLKPLEIVAVLTRVVKLQQLQIEELEARLEQHD
jgi:hypothetical protein